MSPSRSKNKNSWKRLMLVLLILIIETDAFGRRRSHKQNNKKRNSAKTKNHCSIQSRESTDNPLSDEASDSSMDIDPYYDNCGLVKYGFVQKIPYRSISSSGYSAIEVNLSSACMRCGICIAIVERINQSLEDAYDAMYSDHWLDETEINVFLRAICDHKFKDYRLQEIDGKRFIGDCNTKSRSTPIITNADGHWESTLKNKCHEILNDLGTKKLYKHWRDWWNDERDAKSMIEVLCQSLDSPSLRDCHNMAVDDHESSSAGNPCDKNFNWQARFKITAELNSG